MILDFHKDSSTISGYFKKRSRNSEHGPSNSPQSFDGQSSTSEQDLSNISHGWSPNLEQHPSIISQSLNRKSKQDLSNNSQDFKRMSSNLEVDKATKEQVGDVKLKIERSTGAGAVKPPTGSKYHKSRIWKPKPFTHFSKIKTNTKK